MFTAEYGFAQIVSALILMIAGGYSLGRLHQWYVNGLAYQRSYRAGYSEAAQSMLDMTVRSKAEAQTGYAEADGFPTSVEK